MTDETSAPVSRLNLEVAGVLSETRLNRQTPLCAASQETHLQI